MSRRGCIRLLGLEPGPGGIEIVFSGIRSGERPHEVLFAADEPIADIGVSGIIRSSLIHLKAFLTCLVILLAAFFRGARIMMMHSDAPRGPECTVFVVDDDEGAREALQCLLEAEGFRVRAYAGPNDILGEAKVPNHSCLVTDYNMPDMDGLELVAALRA